MTDHYEEKTCPALDLVGLPTDKPVRAYLPELEGVVPIGIGMDEEEAKEEYLKELCNLIFILNGYKDRIISGEETLEVF